jgi:hypothetical protein
VKHATWGHAPCEAPHYMSTGTGMSGGDEPGGAHEAGRGAGLGTIVTTPAAPRIGCRCRKRAGNDACRQTQQIWGRIR